MLSADRYPPYARPPLTKDYLRGESGPDELPLVEPDWYAEHGVELRLGTRVAGVDARRRQGPLVDGFDVVLSRPGAGDRLAAGTAGRARR